MSAGIRAILLVVPLAIFAFWGSVHVPAPKPEGDPGSEIVLASLPSLPRWSRDDLPDFSIYQDSRERKDAFFNYLYPRIMLANARISIERRYLDELADKESLTDEDRSWLRSHAERLRVEGEPGEEKLFLGLKHKLDVIPPSLILAQAANESAWGTSRFATRGNNLFGQWCFSKGCGLVPQGRIEGASHEVAKFTSPYQSVRSYIQNLNRHPTYQPLRDVRKAARSQDQFPSGHDLAAGLVGYSERGMEYVEEIRSMISFNDLEAFDLQFRNTMGGSGISDLQELASAQEEASLLPGPARPGNDSEG